MIKPFNNKVGIFAAAFLAGIAIASVGIARAVEAPSVTPTTSPVVATATPAPAVVPSAAPTFASTDDDADDQDGTSIDQADDQGQDDDSSSIDSNGDASDSTESSDGTDD